MFSCDSTQYLIMSIKFFIYHRLETPHFDKISENVFYMCIRFLSLQTDYNDHTCIPHVIFCIHIRLHATFRTYDLLKKY